jgi:hypothetical protein
MKPQPPPEISSSNKPMERKESSNSFGRPGLASSSNKPMERKESSNSFGRPGLKSNPSSDSKWNHVKSKVKSIASDKKKKNARTTKKGDPTKNTPKVNMGEVVEVVLNGALADEQGENDDTKSGEADEDLQDEIVEDENDEEEEVAVEEEPFVDGQFWWRIEGGRGQHRVNDGGEFQMWSIYRRKDRSRDIKGVSMLVGRMEAPPYDEKVIQIMFDVDVWTEEESFRWWQKNSARYTGSACQQTGKLKLEVVQSRSLDHSPIRSSRKEINVSPIDPDSNAPTAPE